MNYNDRTENEALKASIASLAQIPEHIRQMSLEELRAEQERIAANYRKTGRAQPRHREADLVQAHAEILAHATRGNRVHHPIAEEKLANGGHPTLLDMGRTWAANRHGPEAMGWGDREVLAYATSEHLAEVMTVNANSIIMARAPELQRIPIRLSRAVSLPDFKPVSVGTLTLDAALPEPDQKLREWAAVKPTVSAGYLQAGMSPLRIRFSEILITNDDTESMARTIEAALLAASQNETRMFCRLLTDNVELPDGDPWFNASNTALGSIASDSALAAAMQRMREQTVNGAPADFRPRYWLVPSSQEFNALDAVKTVSVDKPIVEVIPSAFLPSGTGGYLFADPAAWPAVARGTLRGSNGVSLRFSPGSPNEVESARDAILEGMHNVGFAPVSRLGVIRIAPAE
jgi:hypothetical protein